MWEVSMGGSHNHNTIGEVDLVSRNYPKKDILLSPVIASSLKLLYSIIPV
jgi:hypothetical protein